MSGAHHASHLDHHPRAVSYEDVGVPADSVLGGQLNATEPARRLNPLSFGTVATASLREPPLCRRRGGSHDYAVWGARSLWMFKFVRTAGAAEGSPIILRLPAAMRSAITARSAAAASGSQATERASA